MAAMIPVFGAVLAKYGRYWRPSLADGMAIGLALVMGISEYRAAGYNEAQNLVAGTVLQMVAPYLCARLVVGREDLHVELARIFVLILFSLALVGMFEFKFGWNPFLVYPQKLFFAGQGYGWVTTFRYGFARVAGPYAHCILAGMMMIMAYRLNRWLEWGGHWEEKFARLPWLPVPKGRAITYALILGSVTTIARGPWIGGILGALLVNVGRHPRRKKLFPSLFATLVFVAIPAKVAFDSYLSVKPGMKLTDSQITAMYRKELFEKYYDIALDHAWLGWGRNTWPKVNGMVSVDNYYLLLSLMHGLVATGLFVTLMLWMSVRLFRRGMAEPEGYNSLAFTMMAIIIAIAVSVATVYLGENVVPALFLILGWAETYLQDRRLIGQVGNFPTAPTGFSFRHVIR
jgi:hypothetical protein